MTRHNSLHHGKGAPHFLASCTCTVRTLHFVFPILVCVSAAKVPLPCFRSRDKVESTAPRQGGVNFLSRLHVTSLSHVLVFPLHQFLIITKEAKAATATNATSINRGHQTNAHQPVAVQPLQPSPAVTHARARARFSKLPPVRSDFPPCLPPGLPSACQIHSLLCPS